MKRFDVKCGLNSSIATEDPKFEKSIEITKLGEFEHKFLAFAVSNKICGLERYMVLPENTRGFEIKTDCSSPPCNMIKIDPYKILKTNSIIQIMAILKGGSITTSSEIAVTKNILVVTAPSFDG